MKLTVVVPTRERLDTLKWCLKTCLDQRHPDLRIVVSDNSSQDGTADYVRSLADPRISYLNTGKRLGMSQNWEFALRQVTEGFVTFLGDDDGLLPDAATKASALIEKHGLPALVWKKASYSWPDHIDPAARNVIGVPLDKGTERRTSASMLARLLAFDPRLGGLPHEQLPCLYNAFVSVKSIDRARARSGQFFCSQIPDVYSAIALTSSISEYVYSKEPLSINGASRHSGGTSTVREWGHGASAKFFAEENIPFHPDVLVAPSVALLITECVWQVRDNVPNCEGYDVNIPRLFECVRRAVASTSGPGRRAVEQSLTRIVEQRLDGRPASTPNKVALSLFAARSVTRLRQMGRTYTVRPKTSEVSNVYDAAKVCQGILDGGVTVPTVLLDKIAVKLRSLSERVRARIR